MDEKEITKFDITESALRELVHETVDIVEVDIENKDDIEKVKKARLKLSKVRVELKKFGKSKRDWFNEMAKKIIEREKELVAIIEPEEQRLKEFEEEYASKKERKEREALLPMRREQLSNIGDDIEVSDDELCGMDASEFMGYCNKRVADKNEKDRLELEARENAINEKEKEAERKREIEEAKEQAKEEERQRIEREKDLEEERKKKEEEALEKDRKYKKWLKEKGYTDKTADEYYMHNIGHGVVLYKIVGTYYFEE